MKRPIFFTSFFSMKLSGSKFLTSAAIWQANCVASNCVILLIPLLPASRAFQTSSVVLPSPQMRPIPVMTTGLVKLLAAFRILADVIDRVFHGTNLLGIFVGNLDVECFFECHHEFHGVERIGAEIVFE